MILLFLILIPLVSGLLSFVIQSEQVKSLAIVSSLATMVVSIILAFVFQNETAFLEIPWLQGMGASFALKAGGISTFMALLTGIVYFILFISRLQVKLPNLNRYIGLLLLTQAGLMGVFLAHDFLLFYFFWELALIPMYFLASQWGDENRVKVTFKFFVYTFLGSLFMLAGLIYLYLQANQSFQYEHILAAANQLDASTQQWMFWLVFIAFAIKMPLFPFHTWQPDAYETTETSSTIVLSALMVKMGLFAVIKWLLPLFPEGTAYWSSTVIVLSLIGIIYASLIAFVQKDIKRVIAYSSIAHIALMNLGLFMNTESAIDGVMYQMFNHGITVTGLWLLMSIIENKYKTRNMSQMGGMAKLAPTASIFLVILAFSNVGLPLTHSFIGEFMIFNGIMQSAFDNHILFMVLAGSGIILSAMYMLRLVQKVAYGKVPKQVESYVEAKDISTPEWIGLGLVLLIVIVGGIYPNVFMQVFL